MLRRGEGTRVNTRHCCQSTTQESDKAPRPASCWRRGGEVAGWIIPSATLVLLPKCPICVAMYVALFSGVGISVASATHLRTALMVACVAALLGLALKRLCLPTSQAKRLRGCKLKSTAVQTDIEFRPQSQAREPAYMPADRIARRGLVAEAGHERPRSSRCRHRVRQSFGPPH